MAQSLIWKTRVIWQRLLGSYKSIYQLITTFITWTMNNILLNNLPLLVLNQVVSLLYLSTTVLYGAHFFKDIQLAKTYKQPLLALTVLTHVVYLGLLTSLEGYKISYSTVNLMTMVALTLIITYLFIEFTTKKRQDRVFCYCLCCRVTAYLLNFDSPTPQYRNWNIQRHRNGCTPDRYHFRVQRYCNCRSL